MFAGILLRISVIPICYPEWKDLNTQVCLFLIGASLSGEPEEKRSLVYVDEDNAKMDVKEV
jgi:hypothetical protein